MQRRLQQRWIGDKSPQDPSGEACIFQEQQSRPFRYGFGCFFGRHQRGPACQDRKALLQAWDIAWLIPMLWWVVWKEQVFSVCPNVISGKPTAHLTSRHCRLCNSIAFWFVLGAGGISAPVSPLPYHCCPTTATAASLPPLP